MYVSVCTHVVQLLLIGSSSCMGIVMALLRFEPIGQAVAQEVERVGGKPEGLLVRSPAHPIAERRGVPEQGALNPFTAPDEPAVAPAWSTPSERL